MISLLWEKESWGSHFEGTAHLPDQLFLSPVVQVIHLDSFGVSCLLSNTVELGGTRLMVLKSIWKAQQQCVFLEITQDNPQPL